MGEVVEHQTTVFEYFTEFRNIQLQYSGDFPCINVGKPKRPTYIPIEVTLVHCCSFFYRIMLVRFMTVLVGFFFQHCELVSLQRYTKSLTNLQRASLVEKSRQKPLERMTSLTTVGLLSIIL